MPYGNRARNVRAYQYGGPAVTSNARRETLIQNRLRAIDEMHKRHVLWNQLVELDQTTRAKREEIIATHVTATDPTERKAQRKAAFKQPDVAEQLASIEKETHTEARRLCRESGLFWCNSDDVLLNWNQARKKLDPPRFHRWDGSGKLLVRWQTGCPLADLADDTRLQLMPGARTRATVRFRITSDARKPVWCDVPIVLHRPLPPDGIVRSASLHRERIGTHERWSVTFIVETPVTEKAQRPGRVAVEIGWRKMPDGLRVAVWRGDDGQTGAVVLAHRWLASMDKVEDLRSIRDQHFNATVALLKAWLATATPPDWLREDTRFLAQWRACAKLAGLTLRWRERRCTGDDAIYAALEAWRQKDKHLYEWEANQRDQLRAARRHQYRILAAHLAHSYGEVVIEDFDLSDVAETKTGRKQGAELPGPVRANRVRAATYELRMALKNAVTREGGTVTVVDAKNTTRACHACGSIERFDAAHELVHVCSACGVAWDQDTNAAQNLLAAARSVRTFANHGNTTAESDLR